MKLKKEYISLDSNSRMHGLKVPLIGLTGGIATGKSTASGLLANYGLTIINADHLVKSIYSTDEMIDFVKENFPSVIENNNINFKKLRHLAFSDLEIRTSLETEIYAKLPDTFMREYGKAKEPDLIIYDVPLLFEKGLDTKVDLKVCVYADQETQVERLIQRDNVSHEQARLALGNQMNIEEKKNKSDAVIENISTLEQLSSSVADFVAQHLQK